MNSPMSHRRAGIFLHITSLPGPSDCGGLGPDANRFVDFLVDAGLSVWQMLPTGPTHSDRSPYQSLSVHAGNPRFISLEKLRDADWMNDVPGNPAADHSDAERQSVLKFARQKFMHGASSKEQASYHQFLMDQSHWLPDFALYWVVRSDQQKPWSDWPTPLRDRHPDTMDEIRSSFAEQLEQVYFEQFIWFQQWAELRQYANQRGILLFGDMPIFVAYDSAEVWARREYFFLNDEGALEVVAGVPPDYFSATGQRWGNPHYHWDRMQADGYAWWVARMRSQLQLFDLIRIDHFRGFEAYWEIPAEADTAETGRWVPAPGAQLFERFNTVFGDLPLVAEDLGTITPEVHALRTRFGLPGMKILQFAFDGSEDNPYLPRNHEPMSVVYTGTHDNDTTLGWFEALDEAQQHVVLEHLEYSDQAMPWSLIYTALDSVANLAMIPMQDFLALGSEHRLNIPGVAEGNWQWRLQWQDVPKGLDEKIRDLVARYGRDQHP